jgi:hypothetical protein
MLKRVLTPFFVLPLGVKTPPQDGQQTSSPAQALIGMIVGNGRYLLRQKISHTVDRVQFTAIDMVGNIEVGIELAPDTGGPSGYQILGRSPTAAQRDLPNLCHIEFSQEHAIPPDDELESDAKRNGLWKAFLRWFSR